MNKIKTYKELENLVREYLFKNETFEEIENIGIIELINDEIYDTIYNFANEKYTITDKEYRILTSQPYGVYSYCLDKNDLLCTVLISVLEYNLTINVGRSTFNKMLKGKLKEAL